MNLLESYMEIPERIQQGDSSCGHGRQPGWLQIAYSSEH
jgi:hypothetical protein